MFCHHVQAANAGENKKRGPMSKSTFTRALACACLALALGGCGMEVAGGAAAVAGAEAKQGKVALDQKRKLEADLAAAMKKESESLVAATAGLAGPDGPAVATPVGDEGGATRAMQD